MFLNSFFDACSPASLCSTHTHATLNSHRTCLHFLSLQLHHNGVMLLIELLQLCLQLFTEHTTSCTHTNQQQHPEQQVRELVWLTICSLAIENMQGYRPCGHLVVIVRVGQQVDHGIDPIACCQCICSQFFDLCTCT